MKSMVRMKLFAAACIVVLTATAASAVEGRPYVGISAGLFMPTDSSATDNYGSSADIEYNTGYSISGTGGYAFSNGLRLEGELTYKQADMDKFKIYGFSSSINSDISALGFMANAYYDFKNTSPFTPYVGGGIGFATLYVSQAINNYGDLLWFDEDDTVFAYQLGAGVAFDVNKNMAIDLGYRYFGTSDPHFNTYEADFGSHNVSLGFRYKF
jgi:opacity protein-like surface antigen